MQKRPLNASDVFSSVLFASITFLQTSEPIYKQDVKKRSRMYYLNLMFRPFLQMILCIFLDSQPMICKTDSLDHELTSPPYSGLARGAGFKRV